MNSAEVISLYEQIATLTRQMAAAARISDWDSLDRLELLCATQARRVQAATIPALSGANRLHKQDLLRQILANGREVQMMTSPWGSPETGTLQ